jgi:hypothetical protein
MAILSSHQLLGRMDCRKADGSVGMARVRPSKQRRRQVALLPLKQVIWWFHRT